MPANGNGNHERTQPLPLASTRQNSSVAERAALAQDCLSEDWKNNPRWRGIERPYSSGDVMRLRGSIHIEHTLARMGAERLWELLHSEPYVNALGAQNVGVATIPVVSQTGLHPRPFWGSIGAYVSNPNASGASPKLFNESVDFAQYLASPQVELELFNSSGDIPSINSTFQYVRSLNIPFENGFLDQFFNYSQPFPNTPQMTYFWDPESTAMSSYYAGTISAATALGDIQTSIIQQMTTNHIPPY